MELIQIFSDSDKRLFDEVVILFDNYRVFYKKSSDMGLARKFLTARLQANESIIFAVFNEQDGSPKGIGFTQLYPTYSSARAAKNWILNDLYVDEMYRGKGIGKLLIEHVLGFAKADGSIYVQLETATDNYSAQRLYDKIGFQRQNPDTEFLMYRKTL